MSINSYITEDHVLSADDRKLLALPVRKQATKLESLRAGMTDEQKRANDLAQMKGASALLASLPLKEEEFSLNKREYRIL